MIACSSWALATAWKKRCILASHEASDSAGVRTGIWMPNSATRFWSSAMTGSRACCWALLSLAVRSTILRISSSLACSLAPIGRTV